MFLETLVGPFQKARSVNQTSTSFSNPAPQAADPLGDAGTATGAAVFENGGPAGAAGQNSLLVMPYGAGSATNTFSARLWGWRQLGSDPQLSLWVPCLLFEIACTLSTFTGTGSLIVSSSERFADTITLTTGSTNAVDVVSPTGNLPAHVLADIKGFQRWQLSFSTGSSATNGNALVAKL